MGLRNIDYCWLLILFAYETFFRLQRKKIAQKAPVGLVVKISETIKVSNDLNMNITVKIAVNDKLNFKAVTDPISGDYFEGKAKGDLVYV